MSILKQTLPSPKLWTQFRGGLFSPIIRHCSCCFCSRLKHKVTFTSVLRPWGHCIRNVGSSADIGIFVVTRVSAPEPMERSACGELVGVRSASDLRRFTEKTRNLTHPTLLLCRLFRIYPTPLFPGQPTFLFPPSLIPHPAPPKRSGKPSLCCFPNAAVFLVDRPRIAAASHHPFALVLDRVWRKQP